MQRFINNWAAVLTAPALSGDLTLSINPAQAALLTGLGGGAYYLLTLAELVDDAETSWEIVKVTAVIGGVLTVERGMEGTTAAAWSVDAYISARATAGTLETLRDSGGAEGASAYEVAVANGFVGTEAAWLASLIGAPGADGADGAAGPSAYQVAVANGFVGTELEWLESLEGAPGADGADGAGLNIVGELPSSGDLPGTGSPGEGYIITGDLWLWVDGAWLNTGPIRGPQGEPGTDGADGADGASAYQIAVANGFAGTQAEWLASLVGADGADGAGVGDAAPQALGTPTPGTAPAASREDHVHQLPDSDAIVEGATNKWFTTARVLATVLTGLSLATGTAVVDTDTVLAALGKLQKQITDLTTVVAGKAAKPSTRTITGTSGTLIPSDAGKVIICTNAADVTLTIQLEASGAWDDASVVHILQSGAGVVTVADGSGITVNVYSGLTKALRGQHGSAALIRTASDTFVLSGTLGGTPA